MVTLVASTNDAYSCSIATSHVRERELRAKDKDEAQKGIGECLRDAGLESGRGEEEEEVNYFKSAQWTPDGTTLLTSSADNQIRTFILPPTLLDDPSIPLTITPHTTHSFPTSLNCLTPYPHFTLSDPSTTLYLSCPNSLPIRLTNILSPNPAPQATYNLICPTTEKYLTPSSILWSAPGAHFLTGTDCLISLFDVSRPGSTGPTTKLATIPSKRHKMKGGGVGMRGIVSALALPSSPDHNTTHHPRTGILAAGTWTRWIGLYDASGLGGTVATWDIRAAADAEAGIGGQGVGELGWSACGRYLWVAERKSRGVLVYDVRVTGKLVAWLEGRAAETNQRMGVACFEGQRGGGMEIWAGGTDGVVRVWEGVGGKEGACERDWEWRAHEDPIGSTVLHPFGTVIATCSGQRAEPTITDISSTSDNSDEDISDDGSALDSQRSSPSRKRKVAGRNRTPDNSLKVWSLA
ncbi:hypothetical protein DSL72_006016 [Monilinia vaccinii-corymbosi]|uniref:Anaphase-promoting complex subunit 4 WD40 domain-containing protein n=1 Tax=Monilinia vaccinii-corymbosi TaxID=61207 RepID=A0A8A3PHC3_9HELO|nr:hypothetical protein DSL72_006016 [Monilinia vaccinii-corymbosi]